MKVINVIHVMCPELGLYKLLSPLNCSAIPHRKYNPDRASTIERQTGLVYPNKVTNSQSYWQYGQMSTWSTVLPPDLKIEIIRYFQRSKVDGPRVQFRIAGKHNPGWPLLNCYCTFTAFNQTVLEKI